ncbi:MAG: hypothetical protein ACO3DS_09190 [Phycisphaerales bacterium]
MSVQGSKATIQLAVKDVRAKWGRTREEWNDSVSRALEANVVDSLEDRARMAVLALEKMQETLQRMRRECGE